MADTTGRVTIEEGVVFGTGGDRELRCDVFHPPALDGPAPAVLIVHGGGWRGGDRSQLRGYGVLLGRRGYVCVASEYRLAPDHEWPAQIEDVKAAIRWMRANAASLEIDPDRIAIEGNSAGGHLSLMAAGTADRPEFEGTGGNEGVSSAVCAAIAVYPPTLLAHGTVARGAVPALALSDSADAALAAHASPMTYLGSHFPPTMLIHGTGDELVPVAASELMYEALTAAGVPCELHIYPEQPHAFDADPAFGRRCADEMLFFLDRYARRPVTAGAAPAAVQA